MPNGLQNNNSSTLHENQFGAGDIEIRPEHFNLPSQLAKHCNIKGILFLSVQLIGWTMVVSVKNAAYFNLQPSGTLGRRGIAQINRRSSVCSWATVEIRRSKSKSSRKRGAKHESRFKSARTCLAPNTSRPDFYEEFKFRISSANLKNGDKLVITIYHSEGIDSDYAP